MRVVLLLLVLPLVWIAYGAYRISPSIAVITVGSIVFWLIWAWSVNKGRERR